ncbi:hypothetical protein ACP275_08G069200 [Erythranthe tilingii]
MGDHFVIIVDRLITESTLETAIQNKNRLQQNADASPSVCEHVATNFSSDGINFNVKSTPTKLGECRICHDEDEESNMEVPCFCRGTLKYAHRKCVQRWCNEKGDIMCEICHQLFKPSYTAPPPLFHYGGIPMNFRGNWEISRRDLYNPQIVSTDSANGNFLDPNFDHYPLRTSKSLICCRIIAMTFFILLLLHHTLPFLIYGAGEYSVSLVILLILRTIGILLSIYIMVLALKAIQSNRRSRQDFPVSSPATSDGENELRGAHVIQVL